jgi:hypothetical protein
MRGSAAPKEADIILSAFYHKVQKRVVDYQQVRVFTIQKK